MKNMINVKIFNYSEKQYYKGITPLEIAKKLQISKIEEILCVTINNITQITINTPIINDVFLKFNTWQDIEGKKIFWHSSYHIFLKSIFNIFPNLCISNHFINDKGFFCDIDFKKYIFTEGKKLLKINLNKECKKKKSIIINKISKYKILLKYNNDLYIKEYCNNIKENIINIISWKNHHSKYLDICNNIHIPNINSIKIIKILNISGVYWKGDIKNKQLTRIHGISFPNINEYKKYVTIENNKINNDHKKIGKNLNLFFFSEKVGIGLPIWLPEGKILKDNLKKIISEIDIKNNYQAVETPHIGSKNLYKISGHWDKYKNNSFNPIKTPNNKNEYLLKPMNCPHHCEIFKYKLTTYKDLPARFNEFGTVYRYEKSGELNGLTRARGFTQDDGHVFCTSSQLLNEINLIINSIMYLYKYLGFKYFEVQISLRDTQIKNCKKYIGNNEEWEKAERYIVQALSNKNIITNIAYGEAAFYGPKLDFLVKDNLNRKWQLGTIQIDYNLPKRFNLNYKDSNNNLKFPIMIHRAYVGSLERLIAILLEHKSGILPLSLAPCQVLIINLIEECIDYSKNILNLLMISNIRSKLHIIRNNNLNKEIKKAEIKKIPFIIIIGNKEKKNQSLALRENGKIFLNNISFEDFKKILDNRLFNF